MIIMFAKDVAEKYITFMFQRALVTLNSGSRVNGDITKASSEYMVQYCSVA